MNKIAVLADIHGNLKALETALKIIREEQVDRIFVCELFRLMILDQP